LLDYVEIQLKEMKTEKEIEYKSKCCGAPIRFETGMPDFIGDKEGITACSVCAKCGKYCGVKEVTK